jgi:hypothetical protein
MMYDVYWYCQMKKKEWLKILKKRGSREKGGGGKEIHAPCACGHDLNKNNNTWFFILLCMCVQIFHNGPDFYTGSLLYF